MSSIWDYEFTTGGSPLRAGQRYKFEIVDGEIRKNIVLWNENVPREALFKPYDELPANLREVVDRTEYKYPSGDPAPKTADELIFNIKEIETGYLVRYALRFRFPNGSPGKDFYSFMSDIGKPVTIGGRKMKISEVLPAGTAFSAIVQKTERGYDSIDLETVGPANLADSSEPKVEPKVYEPLTNGELAVLRILKKYQPNTSVEVFDILTKAVENKKLPGINTVGEANGVWRSLNQKRNILREGKIILPDN